MRDRPMVRPRGFAQAPAGSATSPRWRSSRSSVWRRRRERANVAARGGSRHHARQGRHGDIGLPICDGNRHALFFHESPGRQEVKGNEAVVRANMLEAVSIAEKIAPYRHHRLAAIKLNKDPVEPPFRRGASMDELRAEMQRHLEILAPVLDLEALLAPRAGLANREVQEERSSGTGS